MKKILVVLTILVLVAGFAFADASISGKFVGQYTFDFLGETQYYSPADKSSFKMTFAGDTKDSSNEGAVYAVAKASLALDFSSAGYWSSGTQYYWSTKTTNFDEAIKKAFSLDTVKIVGPNWSIDLLNVVNTADYAKDKLDALTSYSGVDYAYRSANYDYVQKLAGSAKTVRGVTVDYDGIDVSFAYNNKGLVGATAANAAYDDKAMLVSVSTKEFDFSGVKLQAFVGYSHGCSWVKNPATPATSARNSTLGVGPEYVTGENDTIEVKVFAGSVKAAYEAEKISATVATDFGWTSWTEKFDYDIAFNAAYAPVTFDFYYATTASAVVYTSHGVKIDDDIINNLLSAQTVVALGDVVENVPVTLTVYGKNLINEDTANIGVSANTTALKDFDITVYFKDFLKHVSDKQNLGADVKYTGLEKITLGAGASYSFGGKNFAANASAEYEAELFTVEGGINLEKAFDEDAKFAFTASAVSEKIVSGAKLAAEFVWDRDGILALDGAPDKSFTISCTIVF